MSRLVKVSCGYLRLPYPAETNRPRRSTFTSSLSTLEKPDSDASPMSYDNTKVTGVIGVSSVSVMVPWVSSLAKSETAMSYSSARR